MQEISHYLFFRKSKLKFVIFGLLVALFVSFATFKVAILGPLLLIFGCIAIVYLIFLFRNPRVGFVTLIVYCFTMGFLGLELGSYPFGIGIEVFLLLTWISSLLYYKKATWAYIRTDLNLLFLLWLIYSIILVINPGASPRGWLQEIRSEALYPVLMIPLSMVIFNKKEDLDFFIKLILGLALLAALNGVRQLHVGLTPGEVAFLNSPQGATHMIWGKLRVFSFYDAGQFGASQAVFVVIAVVLAFGTKTFWKKMLLLGIGLIFTYAMLISGTRGALFALVVGAFFALLLTKNYRILFAGGVFMLMFLFVLKFTTIGSGNYNIHRFRTALDPTDPSLNVRFNTQRILKEYMSTRPFGGGLGVLGAFSKYNKDKFLSVIQPDSYWVKIWAMCGIVGLTLWFTMLMYILGKCCRIVWLTQNEKLKFKLIALLSATVGIFFCSYGNEVINVMPSSLVCYLSWAFIYLSPRFDRELKEEELIKAQSELEEAEENERLLQRLSAPRKNLRIS
ncbi:hypothetical protein PBAL39_01407 [Pedobacter sp. BAL39]|uniref:O-antigen ligase family protein n=1 Tax=Pedobacter sp. BAL39 TaxID=391596 RepID=UPI00015594B8|nr:O-antigen ligase family protein [Pedobacter sp. BAL39]EDM38230.1 hypothetical protein PBAL39_01407 [Pedobacter sp. BAL39]